MSKLSALVVAHNEEERLDDCLARLGFADEVVVVLDRCTDASKDIAERKVRGHGHAESLAVHQRKQNGACEYQNGPTEKFKCFLLGGL